MEAGMDTTQPPRRHLQTVAGRLAAAAEPAALFASFTPGQVSGATDGHEGA
jgi:hypothetical protein